MNRRTFLVTTATTFTGLALGQQPSVPESIRGLKPMMDGIRPITDDERRARIEKARGLMRDNKLGAILCEGGSSLFYFTGTRWNDPGGRAFAWVLPVAGEPVWIAAEADRDRAAQAMRMGGDLRTWREPHGPYRIIAQALKDRGAADARLGLEERVRFAVVDGLRQEWPAGEVVSADPVTVGCRVTKSAAELALMQRANDITITAFKAALGTLRGGMTERELGANIAAAHTALGIQGSAMVSFGKYTAFPHGSIEPQKLREGDIVLIDGGCSIEGYQSDITRTTVFGKPSDRQRQIWNLERKAQDAALAAARLGVACEAVDAAARKVITDFGFGPDYKVPGLPHRTGHGIGLDGHEWTNLVRGNKTPLRPGMCFSDEPMIAIYGEFGIRLEDCFYMTENGPHTFTKQSQAIDQLFG